MAATYKCMVCGQPVDKSVAIPYKHRYVHEQCFNSLASVAVKSSTPKKNTGRKKTTKKEAEIPVIKEAVSEEEYAEKKSFFETLKGALEVEKIGAKEYKMADDTRKRYGFTWEGMEHTVKYMKDIKEKTFEDNGIGLIPYYYDEAQIFYQMLEDIEKRNEGIAIKDLYKTKTINMRTKPHTQPILIDINELGAEEC